MTPHILALAASHFLCSVAAEEQVLPDHKAVECAAIYTRLKLSFTDVSSLEDFHQLMEADRARINSAGYAGYRSWMLANPTLIAEMRAEARQKLSRLQF